MLTLSHPMPHTYVGRTSISKLGWGLPMTGSDTFFLGTEAFLLGLSLICANLLGVRKTHRQVYLPLAFFFIAQAVNSALVVFTIVAGPDTAALLIKLSHALTLPIAMLQAPLLWLYVRALTVEDEEEAIARKALHLLPVIAAVGISSLYLTLPISIFNEPGAETDEITPWVQFVAIAAYGGAVLFYLQVAAYLAMIIRRLIIYNHRLKDLFASTESRELLWIWWIAIVASIYWIFNIANIVLQLLGLWTWDSLAMYPEIFARLITVSLIWTLALWGLRQKPGLMREIDGPIASPPVPAQSEKYKNSALTQAHSDRIALKINSAMERDLLYRDPNLSLWDLAKHIGVTSNYVSQTLNETIGESFFDYVNGWRIKDAIRQMNTSRETILVLAYDVGFNSRSSFYKAFKQETGLTPSQLKRSLQSGVTRGGSARQAGLHPAQPVTGK